MSGDTEDISIKAESVDSALIWTDNPELEYFRSMMADQTKKKLDSGLDVDDSLIGDSTIRGMLEVGDDNEPNSRNDGYLLQRQGVRDTSGLSDAESNTVDNIYLEDESILAMKNTLNRVLDDRTIETIENKDPIPPETGTDVEQDLFRPPSQEREFIVPTPRPSDPAPKHLPPRELFPPVDVFENRHRNGQRDCDGSTSIPGVIFVTEGHPSVVRTCPNPEDGDRKKPKGKGKFGRDKAPCPPRSLILSVTLIFIVASTVAGVLVYRMKTEQSLSASSSLSNRNDDFPVSTPNAAPTSAPSNLRATIAPDAITPAPSTDPIELPDIPSQLSPTNSTSISPSEKKDPIAPTAAPKSFTESDSTPTSTATVEPISKVALTSTPTMNPTTISATSPVSPVTATNPSEAPAQTITDVPTTLSTAFSSAASSSISSISSTCASTIETDKSCYTSGENIQISFQNCQPEASDWIGIYPTRLGVRNLHQPSGWTWACGDQLCSDPVANGTATLLDATGFGSFRAYLLRNDDNNGAGYSAYAIGNRFTISSRCWS